MADAVSRCAVSMADAVSRCAVLMAKAVYMPAAFLGFSLRCLNG